MRGKKYHKYSTEDLDFIYNNVNDMSDAQIAKELSKKYKKKITERSIEYYRQKILRIPKEKGFGNKATVIKKNTLSTRIGRIVQKNDNE